MQKERVVITGVSGLLGSHLAEFLLEHGYRVAGICDPKPHYNSFWSLNNLNDLSFRSNFRLEHADVTNSGDIAELVNQLKPDYIYHLAALTSIPECQKEPEKAYAVNFMGTLNLLGAVRQCSHKPYFVFMSTDHVFGDLDDNQYPIETFENREPKNVYAHTKFLGENASSSYAENYDLDIAVVRSVNMAGPRQRIWPNGAVIPQFIANVLCQRELVVKSDVRRTFIHVKDVVGLLAKIIESPKSKGCKVFHASDPRNECSIAELAETVVSVVFELTGRKKNILQRFSEESFEEGRLSLSSRKLVRHWGGNPSSRT